MLFFLLFSLPGPAMEQEWIDDLNRRFPGIGNEFEMAVRQKLSRHGESIGEKDLVEKLLASPDYVPDFLSNAQAFSLHSELMLLYPAFGEYEKALNEAKLLRDFILQYSPGDERVVQTFRGVYAELLIVNGRYEEALEEIERTITLNASEVGNYLSQGVAYVKLNRLEDALESLKTLIQKPGAVKYAQQLFVFIMENRSAFQEAQVQKNTMIDVMLREFEPTSDARIRIPAKAQESPLPKEAEPKSSPESVQTADIQEAGPSKAPVKDSTSSKTDAQETALKQERRQEKVALAVLGKLDAGQIAQLLGPPLMETDGGETLEQDYSYQGETLIINFDKESRKIVSFQMFFLPPIDESRALSQIGIQEEVDAVPTIDSEMLKVWGPYGQFSKLRFSLSEGNVIAVIVEP